MVRVSQSHSGRVNQSEQEWARNAKRWITGTFVTKISFTRCKPKKICVASWPCSLSSPANGIVSLLEMIQSYWIISVLSKYKMQAWLDNWESKHSLHDMWIWNFSPSSRNFAYNRFIPCLGFASLPILLLGNPSFKKYLFYENVSQKGGRQGRSTSFHMYLLYYR